MRSTFLFIAFLFISFSTLQSQLTAFEIERFDKKMEVLIPDPIFVPEFPVGIIYQDVSGDAFTNLNDEILRIADGPFRFQFQPNNVINSELSKNTFSINHFQGSDVPFAIGPSQRAFWGPRNIAAPFEYDLSTFGNISTKDISNRRISALTINDGRGALDLHRYSGVGIFATSYTHTLTINSAGNPVWLVVSDRNYKYAIKDSSHILSNLCKLELKNYKYKGSDVETRGYIAQEVKLLFPELVDEMSDGKLGVNYMGFSTLAVQAIKEQQDIIVSLEDRISRLEKALLEK